MFFKHENPGVRPFDEFVRILTRLFLEIPQLHKYLKMIRDEFRVSEKPESKEKLSSAEAFREKDVETLCQALLPIFYPFPPAQPWTIPETWTDFLNELRLYFTWGQIDNIINIMLENLERVRDYKDRAPISASITDGLRQGLWYQSQKEKS